MSWGPAREDLQALAGPQPSQITTLNCVQFSVFQHCLNNLTCGSINLLPARLVCPVSRSRWCHLSDRPEVLGTPISQRQALSSLSESAAVCQGCSLLDPETLVTAFKARSDELLGDQTWSCENGFASPAPGSRDC